MPSNISSKSTIAKNTTLLYGRTVLVMLVSLYTSRVVLQALGVEDYGIYTAIGGVISFLSVITGPIDGALSRFLTFELGRGNKDLLWRYFMTGMTIMIGFAIISIVLLETLGIWFIKEKMVLAANRTNAAYWVLHLSIAAFAFNLLISPYRGVIIAHEKMSLFAYLGILDAILKLAIAFILKFSALDKLILYSTLLLGVSIFVFGVYFSICTRLFEECKKIKVGVDRQLFGGLFSFAGWNIFGAAASFCRGQGINILFNIFGGPIINAAYGIANQVNSAVNSFVGNFTTALNPSIIKSYASQEKEYMMSLIYQGAKFSYFLVLIFAMPLIIETKLVTKIWLGQTPEYSIAFIQMMLIYSLIESLSKTIMAGVHASGKIRMYQLVIGGFQIVILPISYILLHLNFSPIAVFIEMIIIDIIAVFARMVMAKKLFGLSIQVYIWQVIGKVLLVTITAIPIPMLLHMYMNEDVVRFMIVSVVCLSTTAVSILYIGCSSTEREMIFSKIKNIQNKLTR